jgi:heme A synthase
MHDPTHLLWTAAALFAALAALAAWRDHARGKRRDLDKVGWVPWSLILVMAMLLAVVSGALAVLL